jgi:c-di-GMP-binding flagellar brake protein YcgR
MLSKIIGVGNKIELSKVGQPTRYEMGVNGENIKKVYVSQVYDIIDEDRIKIAVPMDNGKVILYPNNTRIDACFYTSKGLYQGRFMIVDRYKEGNLMVQIIELTNELQKYQRRQYFRLSCTMGIMYKSIPNEEVQDYYGSRNINDGLDMSTVTNAVALDISGGGMRFVSKENGKKDNVILLLISFNYGEQYKKYAVLAKIINVAPTKNNKSLYEYRVEYCNLNSNVREDIIRYIFEEERRRRKKENGE